MIMSSKSFNIVVFLFTTMVSYKNVVWRRPTETWLDFKSLPCPSRHQQRPPSWGPCLQEEETEERVRLEPQAQEVRPAGPSAAAPTRRSSLWWVHLFLLSLLPTCSLPLSPSSFPHHKLSPWLLRGSALFVRLFTNSKSSIHLSQIPVCYASYRWCFVCKPSSTFEVIIGV